MQPVVLSLDCPKLRAALSDIVMSQHWEVLRRSGGPLTAHELAEACGTSDGVAQRMLDGLVEAGLVVRMKATAQRRKIVYRVVSDRVVVQWDKHSDEHFAFLLEFRRNLRAYSRSVIDRHDDKEMRWVPDRRKFRGHASISLTTEESLEVWNLLRDAWEQIMAIEGRARKRAAAHASQGDPASRRRSEDGRHPYHIALEFRPLKWPELPIADIGVSEKQTLESELRYLTTAPASVLTDREREIAERLAAGGSRPGIAKALGVSLNTIASATKRIHAKLGVHSRAELTARLKGG